MACPPLVGTDGLRRFAGDDAEHAKGFTYYEENRALLGLVKSTELVEIDLGEGR